MVPPLGAYIVEGGAVIGGVAVAMVAVWLKVDNYACTTV